MAGTSVKIGPFAPQKVSAFVPANLDAELLTTTPLRPRAIFQGAALPFINVRLLDVHPHADTLLLRHVWTGSGITVSTAPIVVVHQQMPTQESAIAAASRLHIEGVYPASSPNTSPVAVPPGVGEWLLCTEYDTDEHLHAMSPAAASGGLSEDTDGTFLLNFGKHKRVRIFPGAGPIMVAIHTAAAYSGASSGLIEAAAAIVVGK